MESNPDSRVAPPRHVAAAQVTEVDMKLRGACLLVLLLAASSVDAQSEGRLSSSGRTLGDMVRQFPKCEEGMRQKVLKLDSTSDSFIFAAAGSVQGAGGTFFRS